MTKGLDEILSGEASPAQDKETVVDKSTAEPEQKPESEAEPAVAEQAEPEGTQATDEQAKPERQGKLVPQQALHASRERAKSAEERAAELERQLAEANGKISVLSTRQSQPAVQPKVEPPPKPVEFWEAPDKYVEAALTPLQQELAETRFLISRTTAVTAHGQSTVDAAEEALKAAIQAGQLDGDTVTAELRRSRDPVGDVVRWHQNSPAVREQALREKIRAELLAEQGIVPTTEQAPAPTQQPAQVMPTNLAGVRNVGTRSGPAWQGPQPLSDIFDRSRKKSA